MPRRLRPPSCLFDVVKTKLLLTRRGIRSSIQRELEKNVVAWRYLLVAWRILWRSLLQLVSNIKVVIKVSAAPWLICIAALILVWWPFFGPNGAENWHAVAVGASFPWGRVVGSWGIMVASGLWTAVGMESLRTA